MKETDPYEYIHRASDARLAQMLEQPCASVEEAMEVLTEAARRFQSIVRMRQVKFNREAFSL